MRFIWGLRLALAGLFLTFMPAAAEQPAAPPADKPVPVTQKPSDTPSDKGESKPDQAGANDDRIPAASFASASLFSTARISPDGALLALRAPFNNGTHIVVIDAAGKKVVRRIIPSENNQLEWFRWAGNGKILFSVSSLGQYFGEEIRFSRVFVSDIATGNFTLIGLPEEGPDGDEVVHVDPD